MKVFRGGKVYPITSPPLDNGMVVVGDDGKISYVGPAKELPQGAKDVEVVDCTGKVVMPGFVDAHTHIGMWSEWYGWPEADGNEATNPVTPEVRAIDAIWPEHTAFRDAREGGVTTVQIVPGSANVIGGQAVVVKTTGKTVDEMIVKWPSGMKAAFGENPKLVYGRSQKSPMTRMGVAAVMRTAMAKARDYMAKMEKGERDPAKTPDTDLGMQALVRVLKKEIPMRFHAHRADDIATAVRIAREFDLDFSIEHCTDGATIAEFLGTLGARVHVGPFPSTRSKAELRNLSPKTPAVLGKAGCKVSIISDHPFHPIQFYSVALAIAWASGMPEDEALKAGTINPAESLGVADRVGSLEAGKDGDIVVWSDHPFKVRSKVERVFIQGKLVYQR